MKILYLSSPYFADCDFPLVRQFQKMGHDVTYLIMLDPYSLKSTLFNIRRQIPENGIIPAIWYPELKVYESYLDMSKIFIANYTAKKRSSFQALKMSLKIAKLIRNGNYDIVHTDCMLGMWNLMFYTLFGNKMVLTVHDPFPHTGEESVRKAFNYKQAMRKVKHFVLLNSKQKDEFCDKYHLRQDRVLVNRLGFYDCVQTFIKNPVMLDSSKSHNVLFFGRISPYKGVEYLCQAMVKVRKAVPDATLTIAGGGKMYFDITQYKELDWVNVINRYVGMEELAGLLQDSAISVCPYTDATQSGVIMTSYGMHRPVVASNVGGLSEMVQDGKTGLLVPPKEVDALADAIITLLNDDEKRLGMQNYIKTEYFDGDNSWKSIAEKYIGLYKSVQQSQ